MKVGLIHNHRAGDALALEDLTQAIHAPRPRVVAAGDDGDGLAALRLDRLDLVAAAGGDGTIAAVGPGAGRIARPARHPGDGHRQQHRRSVSASRRRRRRRSRPGPTARPRPLDLGVATGPWGERRFVESVGGGLVTHGIVVMDRQETRAPTTPRSSRVRVSAHADVLGLPDAVPWTLTLDGEPIEGEFLMVEVMNIALDRPEPALADRRRPGTAG